MPTEIGQDRPPCLIDLNEITPTRLPTLLREAAQWATEASVDKLNYLDDNPFIGYEWRAVAQALSVCALDLERRLAEDFTRKPAPNSDNDEKGGLP